MSPMTPASVGITLSPEAWGAVIAIALPLIGALVANINLTAAVRSLTLRMTHIESTIAVIPAMKSQLLQLAKRRPTRKARRLMKKKQ